MSPQPPLAAFWCFTWNNYPDDADDIVKKLYDSDECSYIVYQREVGEGTGTPHLQGFLILKKRKRLTAMKKLLTDQVAWYRCSRENVQEKADYCKKDDTRVPDTSPIEYGTLTIRLPGSHEPLAAFQDAVKEGTSWNDLLLSHGDIMARCMHYCREFFNIYSPPPDWVSSKPFEARDWHASILDYINNPDDRKIIFIVDPQGGLGKSTYARHLLNIRDDVQFLKPAKEADIALSIDCQKKVFILDCPRSRLDIPLPYNILESLKDGIVFSGKYQSCLKKVALPNTVLVFTNEVPDYTKLSHDRFVVLAPNKSKSKLFDCVLNSDGSWSPFLNGHTLDTLTNHDVVERKRKLDIQNALQNKHKRSSEYDY